MLRLSRNGIGVLTSQYKSILKKCALLNLAAAGVFLFASAAQAAGETATGETATGSDFSTMGNNIKESIRGGSSYTGYNNPISAYIFAGNSNLETPLFSDTGSVSGTAHTSWIVNYGDVFFGKNESGATVSGTIVSNKHNIFGDNSDVTQVQSGGVIGNLNADRLNGDGTPYIGAKLEIQNTTFENNSTTNFTKVEKNTSVQATGGVLSNISNESTTIRNSTFRNNYAMMFVNALGGAIYNGWDYSLINTTAGGYTDKGLISSGNTFSGNHVGNDYIASSGDVKTKIFDVLNSKTLCDDNNCAGARNVVGSGSSAYALSDHAFGGAVYNIHVYTSENDTYETNYAIGQAARGGAIYNDDSAINDDNTFDWDAKLTFSGALSFLNNSVQTDTTTATASDMFGQAEGGAIYNNGKIVIADNTSFNFISNSAYAINGAYADGGAIYNYNSNNYGAGEAHESIGVIEGLKNAAFTGNNAIADGSGKARGGAIYNAGRMIIKDATFKENGVSGNAQSSDSSILFTGGAVYNAGRTVNGSTDRDEHNRGYLLFDNRNSSNDIVFDSNEAINGAGGGLYNAGGSVFGVIANRMVFTGNTDNQTAVAPDNNMFGQSITIESSGGAIYNGSNSVLLGSMHYNLIDGSQILFASKTDNVYNTKNDNNGEAGLIQFAGSNNSAHALIDSGETKASSLSNVTTYATFLGTGSYEIINTQFKMGAASGVGAGYISLAPQMNMAYSEVVLGSVGSNASHMYLSSDNDILVDNDFYLDQNTILRYDDTDASWKNKYTYDFSKTMDLVIDPLDDDSAKLTFYDGGFVSANSGVTTSADNEGTSSDNFYLGYYVENDGHLMYYDAAEDTDVGIARHLVNKTNGVVRSEQDGYITKNIHIGTLESEGGKIYINMNNDDLVRTDSEHTLIPIDSVPEGYAFGYYEGQHYNSEVITIDKAITGDTIVVFYTENKSDEDRATRYSSVKLDVGQRIYFAQTPGDYGVDADTYTFSVINGINPNYEIKVGYDYNEATSVYDWFLYRGAAVDNTIPPETMTAIDLPRSAVEQLRSLRLPLDRTNRGQCNCYQDQCNNQFCKYEDGGFRTRLWATPFYRSGTFDKPFETDFDLFGVDFGMDFQPTARDEIGIFGSYRNGKYENDGNKKNFGKEGQYFSYAGSEIKLQSWVAGGYYRRYIGDLYLMGALYAGKLDADLKGKNGVKNSVDGVTVGLQGEAGYDIRMTRRSVLTPSLRATYNYIDFDNAKDSEGKEAEFSTIHDVELEAALKLEYQFNNEHELPTTGYIKPSIIQVLASGGKVKVDGREFKDTLDNETYGRIEVGADAELMNGFLLGVFGNYTAGSDYEAWGVGGNVRVVW
ncbi:MAG: autotransporter domain-containing protein [Alphaproteobacteria bacterium]|nr:autotransporter domain-containing protein [Alphaproteobacteria bacterium]